MKTQTFKTNRDGFTLIEIIVVMMIVGVLASMALPRFTSVIQFTYAIEGLTGISVIRNAIYRCGAYSNSIADCGTFDRLDVEDPATAISSHFTYNINILDPAAGEFVITATRNSLDGGNPGDLVLLNVTTAGFTRSGTGVFTPLK